MSSPKVAFVTPVFDGERYLTACLDSALKQNGVEVEVVAVDDGSTDGSADVLATYSDRIRVVHQKNKGVCVARNVGFAQTSAPYVTFLDQDDWVEPEFAFKMSQVLDANPEAAAVYCEAVIHEQAGDVFGLQEGDHTDNMYLALLNGVCPMSPGAVMVRREAFQAVGGFDPSLQNIGEDLDLWIKLARYYPWKYLPEHLYSWRGHGSNMSEKVFAMYRGCKHLLSRYTELSPTGIEQPTRSLRQKQLRCAWDVRRIMKRKLRTGQLKANELWSTVQELGRLPELIPHVARVRLLRRR